MPFIEGITILIEKRKIFPRTGKYPKRLKMCNKIILSTYVLKENENQNSVLWQNESLNFNMYTEGSTFMGCINEKVFSSCHPANRSVL